MKSKEIKILLAAPRGFCAGVERAIEIVKKSINKYGAPVYVRHEIVHNKHVVDGLKKIGAIFVEELDEIKDKTRPVIFSAHGVPKKVPIEAENFKMEYVDATCPLVSKVHREAENLNKNGLQILLIGHKNHPEVIGTMGQIPEGEIDLIENVDDVKKYQNKSNKKLVVKVGAEGVIFLQSELDTMVIKSLDGSRRGADLLAIHLAREQGLLRGFEFQEEKEIMYNKQGQIVGRIEISK